MTTFVKKIPFLTLNYHTLILVTSIFIVLCLNQYFDANFKEASTQSGFTYLHWQGKVAHILILALIFEIVCVRFSIKYIAIAILMISSICAFYMDSLGISIDEDIVQSVFQTNTKEAFEVISFGAIWHIALFGITPSLLLIFIKLKKFTFIESCKQKILMILSLSFLLGITYAIVGKDIVSVFKMQKSLSNMPNPIAPIRSLILYIQHSSQEKEFTPILIAQDAKLKDNTPPQIIVFVIGESTRSANFSLNGYGRDTNPYTKKFNMISFKHFYSCGVVTAISVPCMLTHYTQQSYTNRNLSLYVNNILDIAQSVGYDVWYLGNNGGKCVGQCDRNIQHSIIYPSDSLDEIMLLDIHKIIDNAQKSQQNTFIIAHQYGSHGTLYASRYTQDFEYFTPVCKHKELSKCTNQEIINAYDNSIVYGDYILAQIIDSLQNINIRSMLWYVSDHGESLGELGQYMHGGLGYTFAPDYQKHIPSLMWFSQQWQNLPHLAKQQEYEKLSHDYVFHTLLYLLGIATNDYDEKLNILK